MNDAPYLYVLLVLLCTVLLIGVFLIVRRLIKDRNPYYAASLMTGLALFALVLVIVPNFVSAAELLPGTSAQERIPSVIDGLTEVVAGDNILYVDATGRYLVVGHIYDLVEDKDLTEERKRTLSKPVATNPKMIMPFMEQVAVTLGSGTPDVTVITDPDCSWCLKLWRESLNVSSGLTVRFVTPEVSSKTVGILCSPHPAKTLLRSFQANPTTFKTPAPSSACRSSAKLRMQRVKKALAKANLVGTPILISRDLRVHRGYLSPTDFITWLGEPSHASF